METDIRDLKDETLIRMVSGGDAMAFEEIDRRWRKLLVSFCNSKVPNVADCDEIAQDVLFKVWERAGQYTEASGTFRAWVKRMAANAIVDTVRHNKRKKRGGAFIHSEICEETVLQNSCEEPNVDFGSLNELVETLPCSERRAVKAMLNEQSVAAMAETTELNKGKIIRLRQSAFDRMRECICERTSGEVTIKTQDVVMQQVQQTLF